MNSASGQVGFWLFGNCCSRSTSLTFSVSILRFIRKHAELTEEVFSKPNAPSISLCLCPPNSLLKYIAIDRLHSLHRANKNIPPHGSG
jgi:hypothetical protein